MSVLLVVCLAGVLVVAVAQWAALRRAEHERAGYHGGVARRRRRRVEEDAAALSAIVALTHRHELAGLVAELDRLAWDGTPVAAVEAAEVDGSGPAAWTWTFRDGTRLQVWTDDRRAMRLAARLAGRDALVVDRVVPSGAGVVTVLGTTRREPLPVTLVA